MRKYIIVILIALLLVGCKGKSESERVYKLRSQLRQLQSENERLEEECRQLRKEYEQLKKVYNIRDARHRPDRNKSSGIYDEVFK